MKSLKWTIAVFVGLLLFIVQSLVFDAIIGVAINSTTPTWGKLAIGTFALILTLKEVGALLTHFFPDND